MPTPRSLRTLLVLFLTLAPMPALFAQAAAAADVSRDENATEESADMQRLRRATELSRGGEFGEAERILRDAFDERYAEQRWFTGLYTATDHLVEFLRSRDRYRDAQEIVRAVTALAPPSFDQIEHYSEYLGMLWLEAEIAYQLTDFEEALAALDRMDAAEEEPNAEQPSASLVGPFLRVSILNKMGEYARALDGFEETLLYVQSVRKLESWHLAAIALARGEALFGLGRIEEAEAVITLGARHAQDPEVRGVVKAAIPYLQARILLSKRSLPKARAHLEKALELRKRNKGLSDAVGDDQIGRACRSVENYSCAIAAYSRAEHLFRALLGSGHKQVISVQKSLAAAYRDNGDHAKAIRQLRNALAHAEIAFGPSSKTSVGLLGDLGDALRDDDRFGEAHEIYERLIDAQVALVGPESKEVARALLSHANLLKEMSRFEEAIENVERAREIRARVLGEADFLTQRIGRQLASLYLEVDRYDEALVLAQQSYEAYVDKYGDQADETLGAKRQLAYVHYETGQSDQAVELSREVLAALDTRVDVAPLERAGVLSGLAYYLDPETESEERIALNMEALRIREEALGPRHSLVSVSLSNLGYSYDVAGMASKALPLLQRALEIKLELFGPQHIEVALAWNNLGAAQVDLSLFEQAEDSYLNALAIYQSHWDGPHTDVARVLNNLSILYAEKDVGDEQDALTMAERVVAIEEDLYPENHPALARSLANLAVRYRQLDRYEEAEPLYRRALEIRMSHLDPAHPDVIYVKARLGRLFLDMKRYSEALPLLLDTVAAQEIAPQYETIESRAQDLKNLAEAYDGLGESSRAEDARLKMEALREAEAP